MSLLDVTETDVLERIEYGGLLWCFNVSLEPDRARRKALRILPECVEPGPKCKLGWLEVLNLLGAAGQSPLLATDVKRALNCTETHIYALTRRGLLKATTGGRRGHGGSAHISRESYIRFLKARRHPFPEL